MTDLSEKQKWQALMRGQVINGTIAKYTRIIELVDQKAQGMILLNSILIPVCINGMSTPAYHIPALISIITACFSIFASIICIYPKRSHRKLEDKNFNYLHFNDIGHLDFETYAEAFLPLFNEPEKLAEIAVKDLHDTAKKSILPKYNWIKIAYGAFFIGNMSAIVTLGYALAFAGANL